MSSDRKSKRLLFQHCYFAQFHVMESQNVCYQQIQVIERYKREWNARDQIAFYALHLFLVATWMLCLRASLVSCS